MFAKIRQSLMRTYNAWNDHEGMRLAASLSFYSILSLAPLVILAISLVALVVGRSAAQTAVITQVQGLMGADGAQAVQSVIAHAQSPSGGALASAIGLVTLLFGASGVFGELQSALNKIWEAKPPTGSGWWYMVRTRLFSFGMVLGIGFLLLVSLLLSAGLAALSGYLGDVLPLPKVLLSVLNFVVSFLGISFLFALIFKYVPDAPVRWRDVWLGAVVTALLFTIGKALIGLYLGRAAVGSAYGAAGSLIVVIVWVYYSAMIFFFGAEFTHVRARGQVPL
ncbi:MAG: YihY/virulence factor BrkB family protein [Gammaproteobacteria bacterium]|nr:YihY/virulence factor BrkB family protein [Gammaproteobacteria bacterium]MBV9622280.1 YihY/virulence factor BrkB family protein [Gammaproteobacteria bacterium]